MIYEVRARPLALERGRRRPPLGPGHVALRPATILYHRPPAVHTSTDRQRHKTTIPSPPSRLRTQSNTGALIGGALPEPAGGVLAALQPLYPNLLSVWHGEARRSPSHEVIGATWSVMVISALAFLPVWKEQADDTSHNVLFARRAPRRGRRGRLQRGKGRQGGIEVDLGAARPD